MSMAFVGHGAETVTIDWALWYRNYDLIDVGLTHCLLNVFYLLKIGLAFRDETAAAAAAAPEAHQKRDELDLTAGPQRGMNWSRQQAPEALQKSDELVPAAVQYGWWRFCWKKLRKVFSLTPSPSKGLNGVKRNILADFPIQIRLRRFLSDPSGRFFILE